MEELVIYEDLGNLAKFGLKVRCSTTGDRWRQHKGGLRKESALPTPGTPGIEPETVSEDIHETETIRRG